MICAVHQPNFLPYLGFFDKLYRCDVFVLYDTAQFVKREFHNRNRIIGTHGEPQWLTVPVSVRFGQRIADVSIAGDGITVPRPPSPDARRTRTVRARARARRSRLSRRPTACTPGSLVELNVDLLDRLVELLGGGPRRVLASELGIDPTLRSTDALVAIVQAVGGRHVPERSGRSWLSRREPLCRRRTRASRGRSSSIRSIASAVGTTSCRTCRSSTASVHWHRRRWPRSSHRPGAESPAVTTCAANRAHTGLRGSHASIASQYAASFCAATTAGL